MTSDYLPEMEYAAAYRSEYLSSLGSPTSEIWRIFSAAPCSYIDSPTSKPPTLLELKRHAQSICALLYTLCQSTEPTAAGSVPFRPDGPFDWLDDLTSPYENESLGHNLPLTQLVNNLQAPTRGRRRPVDVCPLHHHQVTDLDRTIALPHATHHALLKHANACLERLDHEYAASGGIMSIVPTDRANNEAIRIMADSTLIGQMITFTQGLVVRNRELEISLDDMRDLLAGESLIPKEILSEIGSEGRALGTRLYSYPQDRFVLSNVTNERWDWLCSELTFQDMREGAQWVDIVTRFTRLQGQTTVFISIGNLGQRREEHAAVVKVVMPKWPERSTLWEERHELELVNARALKPKCEELERKVKTLEEDLKVLNQERTQLRQWEAVLRADEATFAELTRRMAWELRDGEQNKRQFQLDERAAKLAQEAAILKREKKDFERMQNELLATTTVV